MAPVPPLICLLIFDFERSRLVSRDLDVLDAGD